MSDKMVGKITFGGVEFQTPILDVPRDSAERDAMERYYSLGFKAGAEAMREAAAKHIEGGRVVDMKIHVTTEMLRKGDPAAVVQLITADAEAITRQRIVEVIRALPLPEPPK